MMLASESSITTAIPSPVVETRKKIDVIKHAE